MDFVRVFRTRRARIAFNVVSAVIAIGVGLLTARHFVANGWPLDHANVLGVLAAGALFLAAFGFKAWGWHRLFRHDQRPGVRGSPQPEGLPQSLVSRYPAAPTRLCASR
jgi:hypothetical protein